MPPLDAPQARTRLAFDGYVLDGVRRELWRGTQPVAIEPQVFDLLLYLVRNPNRVIGHNELLQAVWQGRIVFGFGDHQPALWCAPRDRRLG